MNKLPQERFLYVKTPAGVNVDLTLNGNSIGTESINAFALGNAVYGFSNSENSSWLSVQLIVTILKSSDIFPHITWVDFADYEIGYNY